MHRANSAESFNSSSSIQTPSLQSKNDERNYEHGEFVGNYLYEFDQATRRVRCTSISIIVSAFAQLVCCFSNAQLLTYTNV